MAARTKTSRKTSVATSKKVERAMHERKRGTLKSGGSGKKVTSKKQAIAMGLSEARREGKKVPPNPNSKRSAKKSAKKTAKKTAKKASKRTAKKKAASVSALSRRKLGLGRSRWTFGTKALGAIAGVVAARSVSPDHERRGSRQNRRHRGRSPWARPRSHAGLRGQGLPGGALSVR